MIGYEFEFLVREGNHPLTIPTYERFHRELEKRGWTPVYDPGTKGITGSKKDDVYVTTDDGVCIMEINAPPQKTIQECDRQMRELLHELQSLYRSFGCSIIGTSVFPGPFDSPDTYVCYKSYIKYYNPIRFEKHWSGLLAIASNHVWLDVDREHLLGQWQFFNRLTPILIALFANGPIFNEQQLGVLDGRDTLWRNMLGTSIMPNDVDYFAMPKREFQTLREYFDFMLSMPFYYMLRDGKGVSPVDKRITYKQFFESAGIHATYFDGTPLVLSPTADDFFRIQQLTFPHVRIKYKLKPDGDIASILSAIDHKDDKALLDCFTQVFLECRGIGAQPEAEISTAPAFVLGLQENFDEARQILKTGTYAHCLDLYTHAVHEGLANQELSTIAKQLLECANAGLESRGYGEEKFLQPLSQRIQSHINPAQELIQLWEQGGLTTVYQKRDFS